MLTGKTPGLSGTMQRMAAMNNLPAMTEEQRQQLIESCQLEIKQNPHSPHAQMAKIALAALTVELFAYSYLYAAYETCDGFTGWSHKFSLEHPPEWMLETGKVKNLRKLYTTPPAPVLRVPDEKERYPITGESEAWKIAHNLEAAGFNECLAEIKRLNTQTAPPESSNEQ